MSLPNRLVVLLLPLLIAGCGFQPLYGKKSSEAAHGGVLAGVKIDKMGGRIGQQFKADLEDKLNPGGKVPPNPAYRLHTTLQNSVAPIGVARDGTVSRYNVNLSSSYVLYRNSDGAAVTNGNLRHVSSYNNVTNAYFSTYISEADAVKRGITELSEIYRQRLAAYLSDPTPPPPPSTDMVKEVETPQPSPMSYWHDQGQMPAATATSSASP